MNNKLYKMMNWPEIESIVYSECDNPHDFLGKHPVQGGTLVQCFFPGAVKVILKTNELKAYPMEQVDEEGFYAIWFPEKNIPTYFYEVYFEDKVYNLPEVYDYLPKPDKAQLEKFYAGIFYDMYEIMGAHEATYREIKGVSFMVYAPMALRVSVVGRFNSWDGRLCQMSRLGESGIFSIFIPGLSAGEIYKYEIKLNNGTTYLKRDPFSFEIEKDGTASIIKTDNYFSWKDARYLTCDRYINITSEPLTLAEIRLEDFYKEGLSRYDSLNNLIGYIKKYGYSAAVLGNIGKKYEDIVCKSLYATDPIYGDDIIKYTVNGLHEAGIPVLFTIDFSSMDSDYEGLCNFDGRRLYEENDGREIEGRLTYDFSKKYVRNYLISVAFYYLKNFHADGFVLRGTDRILYLNYGRIPGDFAPNIYGGINNLGGEEFLKHLNSVLHKKNGSIITIAGDSLNSNNLTRAVEKEGFGFDYKFDNHMHQSLFDYFKNPIKDRVLHYSELTNILINAYLEEFILLLPKREFGVDEKTALSIISGTEDEKIRTLRLLLSLFYFIPGRKCLPFTGLNNEGLETMLIDLQDLYYNHPALNELDNMPEGFEWIETLDKDKSIVSFKRKGRHNSLYVIINLSDSEKEFILRIPKEKKLTLIYDSENSRYNGTGHETGIPKEPAVSSDKDKNISISLSLGGLVLKAYEAD